MPLLEVYRNSFGAHRSMSRSHWRWRRFGADSPAAFTARHRWHGTRTSRSWPGARQTLRLECTSFVLLRTMPAYCATELQGAKCTDDRCQYRHDIIRCEPCGRSFPASLLNQHESGKLHFWTVHYSSGPSDNSGTPAQHSPSGSSPSSPQTAPSQTILSPSSGDSTATVPDPRVIVSAEGGLNFFVEGMGTVGSPFFPVMSRDISIEKTTVVSSLSVESMTLKSSPAQWCE